MSETQVRNILDTKLKKGYQIIVPFGIINEKIDAYIAKVKGNYSQSGFRKGHVPEKIIKDKYAPSIMAEESEKIINENIKKLIEEKKYSLAISPKIDIKDFEYGSDFQYDVTFELLPEIPEIAFDKIKITKKELEVSDKDIDEEIKKTLTTLKDWSEKKEGSKIADGDQAYIDYVGKIDGEEFEGGKAQNQPLEIGSKTFIDTFEKQLIGSKIGDEVLVKVKFPKEYHKKEFADAKAEFDVKINKIMEASEPKLTDKLVQEKFQAKDIADFKNKISEKIAGESKNISNILFKSELTEYLNKKFHFELPEGMVGERFDKIWAEIEKRDFPKGFTNDKEKTKSQEKYKKDLEKHLRCSLIFGEEAQRNKITVTQEDINNSIAEKAKMFPGQEEMFKNFYLQNKEMLTQIQNEIFEMKISEFFEKNIHTKYKKLSSKDLEKDYNHYKENTLL
ncbi:trigger factor [Rickettsiales bacterium]|nr:trigger factor [Rickettsiales bacterium]